MSSNVFKCSRGYTVGVIVSIFFFRAIKTSVSAWGTFLFTHPNRSMNWNRGLLTLRNIPSVLHTWQINSGRFPLCLLVFGSGRRDVFGQSKRVTTAHTWYTSDGRHDNACAPIQIATACSYNSFWKISRGPVEILQVYTKGRNILIIVVVVCLRDDFYVVVSCCNFGGVALISGS